MKLLLFFAVLVTSQIPPYQHPGPDDRSSPFSYIDTSRDMMLPAARIITDQLIVRGPCPGLNTLANHGLLPRSGKNITQDDLSRAMWLGVSQDDTISVPLFGLAATTNPSGDNTTFSLPDLGRHNILEHDASLRCVCSFDFRWANRRAD